MESRFGNIEAYFSKGLGLSNQTIDALRSSLVASA